jgi:hypothetical protein
MKTILETPLIKITEENGELVPTIKTSSGQLLEHNHMENNLKGMVAALTLALDVLTGRFYPMGIKQDKEEEDTTPCLELKQRLIAVKKGDN